MAPCVRLAVLASLAQLAALQAHVTPLLSVAPSVPPLPEPCAPFAAKGGQPVECVLELYAGQTYVLYTECDSVKGDTSLTLRDPSGADVAFNDGFPFCPGDSSASLVEFYVECGLYGASAKFSLLQDCFEDTECGGRVVVEYSSKEPPVDCGRGPFACTKQDAACEALGDLYYATNGDGWLRKTGWESAAAGVATDYCSFYSLLPSCNRTGGLFRLHISGNQLRGSIPASLGSLTQLTYLHLYGNEISGSIPASLGSLTRLKSLCVREIELLALAKLRRIHSQLYTNQLSGTIPASLSSLTQTLELLIDHNELVGSLPDSLGSLTQLQLLYVRKSDLWCSLTKEVPSSTAGLSSTTSSAAPFPPAWAA
jgi:hypothetical protein